ncbi:hypothetical protein HOK00_07715 [bacterium]|jgi:hypothetical protein|nr:hypothetical protein [bacterium]
MEKRVESPKLNNVELEKKINNFFIDLNIITEQLDEEKSIEELTPTDNLINVLDELITTMEKENKEFNIREFVAPFSYKENGDPYLSYTALDSYLIKLIAKYY